MDPDGDGDRGAGGKPPGEPRTANMGIAFDLGIRLGVSVIVGLGGGLLLDSWLHTSPIFTLIGMALGIGAAMYTIWDVARDAMRK
jgi:F0F1-type ATP synthase assembly protein I